MREMLDGVVEVKMPWAFSEHINTGAEGRQKD